MKGCQCDLREEQAKLSRRRELEAITEAAKYRAMWQAAASCLAHNSGKITPRGEDEKAIINIAIESGHGVFWSGKTNGWIS